MTKEQRLVHKSTGLKDRSYKVNQNLSRDYIADEIQHMWACQGCGTENDPWYLSCRICQTLRFDVRP